MYNFNFDESSLKLQITGERFFINEAQKTITVTADVKVTVPDFVVRTINDDQLPNGFVPAELSFWSGGSVKVKHTARCAPEDQWDVEKGKKIALAGLEAKAYRSMVKRIMKWQDRFNGFVARVNLIFCKFVEKSLSAAAHDDHYIRDIS